MVLVKAASKKMMISLVLLFSILSCSDVRIESGSGGEAVGFRVALLTSGPVSDAGWYGSAYEGIQLIEKTLGARISHQQTNTPAEYDEALRAYASSGYQLIFAHGFEYQDAAIRVGQQFPSVTIIVSSGGRVSGNVIPLIFELEEGSYMAGVVASRMTKTRTIGMVGGVAIPPAEATFIGFEAGAKSVDPSVEVLVNWIGTWDDVAMAKEAAVTLIRRGVDVLIHNTDAASFGVFQAVREARESGAEIWAMGMNRDQNSVAPEAILGSAIIRIPEAFLQIANLWSEGRLPSGEAYYAGGRTGAADYVLNPELADRYDPTLMAEIDSVRLGIVNGMIAVPRIEFLERVGGSF
ncbi:MAG: BMP family ABC transporter substrate-binding protein [Gemmatimonadetes bacterium]|nr:BMP family ABC transporter substrate-binding protein [Gemmatimonadota bacterium]